MYNYLKRMYDAGKLTKASMKNAVIKNWITPEQYAEITGEPYEEDS
ncbi:MAG: XkdX family protein [Faecalibacterium sp.]